MAIFQAFSTAYSAAKKHHDARVDADRLMAVTEKIRPILGRENPAYQGLVLANLLGIWLSGCPLHLRDEMMEDFLKRVVECTSLADKVLRENGHPR
jgi:hypothetical protein